MSVAPTLSSEGLAQFERDDPRAGGGSARHRVGLSRVDDRAAAGGGRGPTQMCSGQRDAADTAPRGVCRPARAAGIMRVTRTGTRSTPAAELAVATDEVVLVAAVGVPGVGVVLNR